MDQACQFVCACQDDILIDDDSTKTDTYGNQEGSSWIHQYQQTGYHPFVVNEYNTGALLRARLLTGNPYSPEEAEDIMDEVLKIIPDRSANGKMRQMRFRGYSDFYSGDLRTLF